MVVAVGRDARRGAAACHGEAQLVHAELLGLHLQLEMLELQGSVQRLNVLRVDPGGAAGVAGCGCPGRQELLLLLLLLLLKGSQLVLRQRAGRFGRLVLAAAVHDAGFGSEEGLACVGVRLLAVGRVCLFAAGKQAESKELTTAVFQRPRARMTEPKA